MSLADKFEFAACTDTGLIRPQNEDSLVFDAEHAFALLADGMGGYNAGEVASQLAVTLTAEGLRKQLPRLRAANREIVNEVALLLRAQIEHANAQIFRQSMSQPQLAGMGTTLVALALCDGRAVLAHVGDSRAYRFSDGVFERLTRDHTLWQERVDSGEMTAEMAARIPHRSLLTRALGVEPAVEAELGSVEARPGDIFLLCSDGLPDMLEEAEIAQVLADGMGDLPATARRLVEMANDYGGFDNISVVLARVGGSLAPAGTRFR